MTAITERCSVCSKTFEVQFRYQMEEREGSFSFFCSQACQGAHVRGESTGGVVCDYCGKRFQPELVVQVLAVHGVRRYACSEECRQPLLAGMAGHGHSELDASARAPATLSAPPFFSQSQGVAPEEADRGKAFPLPHRLAVFNHKGGTGKTTTSVTLSAGLAARGLRVLLVDTDAQGNVAVSLGIKAERSLYHLLLMELKREDIVVPVSPGFDLIVANETLAAAELYLAGRQKRDSVLRDRLLPIAAAYDIVILDCSPSLSLLNQNALVFAEGILVPVACDFLSLVGMRQVLKTLKNVNHVLHHTVHVHGVLPTFYDARARICRDTLATLRQHFGPRCLAPIRAAVRVKEAPAHGKTLFDYAPEAPATSDYRALVEAMLQGYVPRSSSPIER